IYVKEIYKQTLFDNRFVEYVEKPKEDAGVKHSEKKVTQRELLFQTRANNKVYEVTVCISLLEGQKMGEYIIGVVLIFLIVSIFLLFL
ncbi:UNVERIFIED_CONTAM: hypothetical protein IGO34_31290, partial [Salmonella enterica subsp. enterica serovar Weltevreden]